MFFVGSLLLDKHSEICTFHYLNVLNFDELQNLMCLKLWNLLPSRCSKNLGVLERILRNRELRFTKLVLAAESLMHIIIIPLYHSPFCVHYFLMLEKRKILLSKVTSPSGKPNLRFICSFHHTCWGLTNFVFLFNCGNCWKQPFTFLTH